MAQVGVHAVIGLVGTQVILAGLPVERPLKRALAFGFVLGNILPDFDYLAAAMVYPHSHELAFSLHRGFTHSLLAALVTTVGMGLVSLITGIRAARYSGYGLGLGILVHIVTDVFIWFSPVDVLWPLGYYGFPSTINLWGWWSTPELLSRLLASAEYLAWALYCRRLWALTVQFQTNVGLQSALLRTEQFCLILWAVFSALAFDVGGDLFFAFYGLPMGIVFMPLFLYLTCLMQPTIEALATPAVASARLFQEDK